MNAKESIIKRVTIVTISANVILAAFKIFAGLVSNSAAVVADGIHSLSDILTTIVAYIGVKISIKKADEEHQYGHEKFEPVMSKLLALVLFLTAFAILYKGYRDFQSNTVEITSDLALYAAGVSIIVKEWMYHYTIKAAKKINSTAFKADAWHHRTDAFSSIGALIGVGGAKMGYSFLEPLATIFIGVLIIKVAVDIYIESIKELTDTAADLKVVNKIKTIVNDVDGVERIDMLKTRKHGSLIYVDIEIAVDGKLSLYEAHDISQNVHDSLEEYVDIIKHCMVHVNPI